ncbi:MAG: peptidylprolyl isomerase [Pseudomonadota bacterium]
MKRLLPLALFITACSQNVPSEAEDIRPNVVLETTLGEIEIEVYTDTAPISGGDFLMYVDEGLFDGEGFYRSVRPDNDPRGMGMSLIQGGIIEAGTSDDDYGTFTKPPIAHERTTDTGLSNVRGVVSIARLEPGTGSAGFFFINIGDNSFLDTGGTRNPDGEGYATFATVVRGMDVIETIQAGDTMIESPNPATNNQYLTEPVIITRAYRVDD